MPKKEQCYLQFWRQFNLVPSGLPTVIFVLASFLSGIAQKDSYFIIRQHKSLPVQEISPLEKTGASETGFVFEQQVQITNSDNSTLSAESCEISSQENSDEN